MSFRTWGIQLLAVLVFLFAAQPARAQDAEHWKKMYDDALNQLKAAQERKNQLAADNERLTQQLETMKKELAAANARLEEFKRIDADHAEKTFFLRAHYMAWQQFLTHNADTQVKWNKFLESAQIGGIGDPELIDRHWPAVQPGGTTRPSTMPASTEPTTQRSTAPMTQPSTIPSSAPATHSPTTHP